MKRMTKKLMAAFLAVVMTLSLSVGAFAAAPTPAGLRSDETTNSERAGSTDTARSVLGASIRQTATARFEGMEPDDLIRVVLPTQDSYVANMILDPNNLIRRTNQVAYHGYKFAEDSLLYFKNIESGGGNLQRSIPVMQIIDREAYAEDPTTGQALVYVNAVKYVRPEISVYTLTENYTDAYALKSKSTTNNDVSRSGNTNLSIDGFTYAAAALPETVYLAADGTVYKEDKGNTYTDGIDNTATSDVDILVSAVANISGADQLALYGYEEPSTAVTKKVLLNTVISDDSGSATAKLDSTDSGYANAIAQVQNATQYDLYTWELYSTLTTKHSSFSSASKALPDFTNFMKTDNSVAGYKSIATDKSVDDTGTPDITCASGDALDGKTVDVYRKFVAASMAMNDNPGYAGTLITSAGGSIEFGRDTAKSAFGYVLSDGTANENDVTATSGTSTWTHDTGEKTEVFFVSSDGGSENGYFYVDSGTQYGSGDPYAGVEKYELYEDKYNQTLDAITNAYVKATYETVTDLKAASYLGSEGFTEDPGDTVSYSGTSDAMTIINKSSVDLGVNLEVNVDKSSENLATSRTDGAQDEKFFFVDSPEALDTAKQPSIYLALISGNKTSVVKDPAYYSSSDGDGSMRSGVVIEAPTVKIDKSEDAKGFISDINLEWTEDFTSREDKSVIEAVKETINSAIHNKKVKVAFTYSATEPSTLNVALDPASGNSYTVTNPEAVAIPDEGDIDDPVTIAINAKVGDDTMAVANIEVTLNAAPARELTSSITANDTKDTATVSEWVARSTAKMSYSIPQFEDAFQTISYMVASSGEEKRVYETVLKSDYVSDKNNSDFEAMSFRLTGNINPESADVHWEELSTFGIEIVYDVHKFVSGEDEPLPEAAAPTVKVTTAGSNKNDPIVLSYDLGAGTLKVKEYSAVYYKKSTGANTKISTGVTHDAKNGTISFKLPEDLTNTSNYYVEFSTKTSTKKNVTFDPATVTQ